VLSPLAPYDLLWLAALPAISEELLFRGALIPALSPDWCVCGGVCWELQAIQI
jgi:membrane protease YdiL (CAAX protease family)